MFPTQGGKRTNDGHVGRHNRPFAWMKSSPTSRLAPSGVGKACAVPRHVAPRVHSFECGWSQVVGAMSRPAAKKMNYDEARLRVLMGECVRGKSQRPVADQGEKQKEERNRAWQKRKRKSKKSKKFLSQFRLWSNAARTRFGGAQYQKQIFPKQ